MNEMMNTLKGVILLDEKTYQAFLTSENVMKRGILIFLACFLVVALPTAIGELIDKVQPFTAERAEAFQEEVFQGFEQALPFMPADENIQIFMEEFKKNFAYGTSIGVAVDAIPTPLPRPIAGFLSAFGSWLSSPLAHLASWMGYAIWVLLFSKMANGYGGVNRLLGLTALYAVPNILAFFSFIPILGGVLSLVGVLWGWLVYVKAVEVSQEFSMGKAVLVALLPFLLMFAIAFIAAFFAGISIAAAVDSISF